MQQAYALLKQYFGYDTFRPLQEEIISHVFWGHDALVIMPTGWWKSLCFQLPALLLDGLTIVISPLIALMKDQVDALRANGIDAAYINSSLESNVKKRIWWDIKQGNIRILYIAPESIQAFETIKSVASISLIAVDEAHCISSWWHDFRPAYTQLGVLKKSCPDVPLIALTATADATTRNDMVQQLGITDAKVFLSSFDRPNLSLTVRPWQKRIEQIANIIATKPWESGIIYCLSRNGTHKVADKLVAIWIAAEAYHAWLSHEERQCVQDNFVSDRTHVICATIAFGMWIDKANVRYVIHYNLPKNIEWYYQEIWRAWRDGLPADTILFYSYADIIQLTKFAQSWKNAQVQLAKLERMKQYAESLTCRRKILLHYFGESRTVGCGSCDVCLHPPEMFDGTIIAQKALSTVYRLQQRESMRHVIEVLRGSKNAYIIGRGYDSISTHGIGKDISPQDRQRYMIQLLNLGYVSIAFDQHDALKLTSQAQDVLFSNQEVLLARPQQDHISQKSSTWSLHQKQKVGWYSLYDQLVSLRQSLAQAQNIASHTLFSDLTLREIADKEPTSLKMLARIQWLGDAKVTSFGKKILAVVHSYHVLVWKKKSSWWWVTKHSTFMQTYDLLKHGESPESIAEIRELNTWTIYGHIARLYTSGKDIDPYAYADKDILNRVVQASQIIEYKWKMKPLYDYFNWEIDYNLIKLWIAIAEKKS